MILPFILPNRRARWTELLTKPRGRRRLMDALWHGRDLNPRFLFPIEPQHANPQNLTVLLQGLGSPEVCHVLSVRPELDGKDLGLPAALEEVVGIAPGTVISCLPGKLGYYERDEKNGRYLLKRP